MGTLRQWQKLVPKVEGNFMPFIIRRTKDLRIDVDITRNVTFWTLPRELRMTWPSNGILKNCHYKGKFVLTEANTKQLQAIYPGFCFTHLEKFVRLPDIGTPKIDFFGKEDMKIRYQRRYQNTKYNKMPLTEEPFKNFFIQNNEYSKWFKKDYNVFYSTSLVDIPEPLTKCEELFDKNVLPIKKLVKDISDLNNLTIKETKNFFLYDDGNLISNTFFTELNKKIQAYGYISLLYNNSNERLITSKNRLNFNVLLVTERELLTLQFEDILTPKKIETTDSKIKIFSILATGEMNKKIIDKL